MPKYAFFYPETGERHPLDVEFNTAEEAVRYWQDKRQGWGRIKTAGKRDEAAFMSKLGCIIVVRMIMD